MKMGDTCISTTWCLVALVLQLAFLCCSTAGDKKRQVVIFDYISTGDPLTIHCASGSRDVGAKTLTKYDQYAWRFSTSSSTLYHCSFHWNGYVESKVDIYKNRGRDEDWCVADVKEGRTCYWYVTEEGFYRYKLHSDWFFIFGWA